jgi:glycerol-3-phosphate dehydrogenase (NAD(P)+)
VTRDAKSRVLVLGAGSWGTTLARLLARAGHEVRLWCRDAGLAAVMEASRENPRYLPGYELPAGLGLVHGLDFPALEADFLVVAVPAQRLRSVLARLAPRLPQGAPRVTGTKGIERGSLMRVSQMVTEVLGPAPVVALSGPSFAMEVAQEEPTAVTAAAVAAEAEAAVAVQWLFSTSRFRVYTSNDLVGVELGGALKNVIAIAVGIAEGLGLGRNAQAALLTRGLAEMTRLGVALGGEHRTFLGLSGVGDLVLTATGERSRNRRLGVEVGRGRALASVLADTTMVAEGVDTALSALELAQRVGVELPIVSEVQRVLFQGRPPRQALSALMGRDLKPEVGIA